jgi:methyl-accepting chemotaxis protein/ABC-type sugar transport system substrate-binding protein
MASRLIRFFRSRSGIQFGLIVILVFIGIGLSGVLLTGLAGPFQTREGSQTGPAALFRIGKLLLWVGLAGGGVMAVAVFLAFRAIAVRPFDGVVRAGRLLTSTDLKALTDAMSELARGNFSKRLAIQTAPLSDSASSEFDELIGVFNGMILSLGEIIHEFNSVNDVPCLRLCFVGGDVYLQGRLGGETMGKALQGSGDVAVFTGFFHATGQELRRKGFQSLLNEKYDGIRILEVLENREDPEIAYKQTKDLLKRHPRLSGIYITEGATPQGVARAVAESKRQRPVKIVCHDITDETMRYVKKGVITATVGDNSFAQGHDPVIHLFNHLAAGWQPETPRLLIDMDVVTKANARHFWEEGRGVIQSPDSFQRLAAPMNAPVGKPLRLAVIGCENSSFWYPVRDGVLAAAESLKPYNVTVQWIAPKQDLTAEVCAPILQSLIDEHVDGIATIVEQRELVPFINRAVGAGIPVISFITEPISLKGLLFSVVEHTGKLMDLSQNMSKSALRANQATSQINAAMSEMAQGMVAQDAQVNDTRETLRSLIRDINQVSRESKTSAGAVERTVQAVTAGTDAMAKTMASIRAIEQSVTGTRKIADELTRHSERIDGSMELIEDITSRVNVLALNAVIEATRAGESGRGFMTVANEIRALSRNTREASCEITDVIQAVKMDIDQIEKVMSDGLERIRQSAGLTDEAVMSVQDIRRLVDEHKQRMTNIAESLRRMQSFSLRVGEAMEKVAGVSGKNAAVVEGVGRSTVEMGAQLGDVAASARLLEEMAKTEQQLLTRFDLSGDETA